MCGFAAEMKAPNSNWSATRRWRCWIVRAFAVEKLAHKESQPVSKIGFSARKVETADNEAIIISKRLSCRISAIDDLRSQDATPANAFRLSVQPELI
jgi:hypothetical protein